MERQIKPKEGEGGPKGREWIRMSKKAGGKGNRDRLIPRQTAAERQTESDRQTETETETEG